MMLALQQRLFGCGKNVYWRMPDVERIARRYGVTEREVPTQRDMGSQTLAPSEPATRSSGDKITGPFDFFLTTESVDSYGDIVKHSGIRYRRFDRNPIALGYHNGTFPVGTWSNRRSEGSKLRASLNFSSDHAAQRVARSVQEGVLRGCSIGFMPIRWEFSTDKSRPLGIDFHEIELCEASVVSVPAVPDALLAAAPSAKDAARAQIAELRDTADRARNPDYWRAKDKLDEMRAKGWIT